MVEDGQTVWDARCCGSIFVKRKRIPVQHTSCRSIYQWCEVAGRWCEPSGNGVACAEARAWAWVWACASASTMRLQLLLRWYSRTRTASLVCDLDSGSNVNDGEFVSAGEAPPMQRSGDQACGSLMRCNTRRSKKQSVNGQTCCWPSSRRRPVRCEIRLLALESGEIGGQDCLCVLATRRRRGTKALSPMMRVCPNFMCFAAISVPFDGPALGFSVIVKAGFHRQQQSELSSSCADGHPCVYRNASRHEDRQHHRTFLGLSASDSRRYSCTSSPLR